MKPKILLVDDEPATLIGLTRYLSKEGYTVEEASCLAEAQEAITSHRFHAVILDLILPDGNGIELIRDLRETYPDTAIVVITGAGDIPTAVEAMRRGADNFLTKPINLAELDVFLQKSLELGTLRRRDSTFQRFKKKVNPYFSVNSPMKEVEKLAILAAENDSPVLLQGETGTGKGVLARWIHEQSSRCSGPFVEVNCSSLRGELLASELFGHVKGAFTSAIQDKQGLIEVADGGTLFLDEISDMDLAVQAQFLKVIEEKCYRRLGEVKVRRSDFRLICATNKNLQEETQQGKFREDLYFRINIFPISIPPLRERLEDLTGIIQDILADLGTSQCQIIPDVIKYLRNYLWPGNIRELRNVLERALILARNNPLTLEYFPNLEASVYPISSNKGNIKDLERLEGEHIKDVIKNFGGDKRKAAEALRVSRATLYRKIKKYKQPL